MSYRKYFPLPMFTHVNEDGEITLEWVTKNNDRLMIAFDNSKDLDELESNMYAIYTAGLPDGKVHQELMLIHGPQDVVKALGLLGLKAEE